MILYCFLYPLPHPVLLVDEVQPNIFGLQYLPLDALAALFVAVF